MDNLIKAEITSYHAKYFAHELTKKLPSNSPGKFTAALQDAQVDLNPHQVEAALFAFKSPLSKGAILADEVGLGKTIEAGIILSQKWAEQKTKLLIIAPSNLRKQWSQELSDKFYLPSVIMEAKPFNLEIKSGVANPFIKNEIVICSYQFARAQSRYISQIDWDLVISDEAHRYHADASKNAINELKPVLGIELTATPIDEKGNPFRNVVYEYSLAKALSDGKYVKNPAVATRKNLSSQSLNADEIEKMKLEDAVSIHQVTRSELEIYALNNNVRKVKPFMLVVCKDINHAKEVYQYVSSNAFFSELYKEKVLQIDSSTKREEDIERLFVDLEQYDNEIEIVIHVNILKEGWDVNNLYTIVPLRAANAAVLIEQTIGRGLRLPYNGERTGDDKIDKLTVIAHDNFNKIIEAAQDPNSVMNKFSFIEITDENLQPPSEVITSIPKLTAAIHREEKLLAKVTDEKDRQIAKNVIDAKKLIVHHLPDFNSFGGVQKATDLKKPEIKTRIIAKIQESLDQGTPNLFADEIVAEVKNSFDSLVSSYIDSMIELPRMDLVQDEIRVWFEDFDLDTSKGFNYEPMAEEIMVVELTGEGRTEHIGVMYGAFSNDSPVNQVTGELMNYSDIEYDENSELLHKLVKQAIGTLNDGLEDKSKLPVLIRLYRKYIAARIYAQMKLHYHMNKPEYIAKKVLSFVKIEDWNFSCLKDGRRHFKDVIIPKSLIPKLVFSGFEKACHFGYKFDSGTEKDFVYILENDSTVLKWMRPAPNQFRIYFNNNSQRYEPDFIVETADTIYMVEIKAEGQINTDDVIRKKEAALNYCKYASDYTAQNGGKPWKYLLIPHNEVNITNTFGFFSRFKC